MDEVQLQNFIAKLDTEGRLFENFYRAVRGGENKVCQNVTSEAMVLDDSWILTIDAALYSIEQIAKNPKRFIAEDESVVDVARAKKTNAKTIRHLASNSKDISTIERDGSVRPKRVLTTEYREDIGIYENRFVISLVNRLSSFVDSRNSEIRDKFHVHDLTTVTMGSKFRYGEAELTYQMEVTVKEPPHDRVQLEKNYELLRRVDEIRKRIRILKNSEFYRSLKDVKPVLPPIQKTNIIKMNVDYQNCYKLWLFISSYTFVGYSVEVKDKMLPVDGDFYDDLTVLSACSVQTLGANQAIRKSVYDGVAFSEPKEKPVKIVKNFKYTPRFVEEKKASVENDSVNEYFFLKMKDALKQATEQPSRNTVTEQRELTLSFGKFYRAVSKISNEMYSQLLTDQVGKKKTAKRRSNVKVKQDEYDRQSKVYRRYKLLSKLKADDLERALKEESKELVKLEKMKYDLDQAKERAVKKSEVDAKKKKKLQAIAFKSAEVQENAKRTEAEMLAETYDQIQAREDEKIRRREEQKRRRELRQLELLKQKYEENSDS